MFYFAWVENGGTAFGPEHQVEDENVFQFTIEHTEGDFASLSVDIINPRIGLLNDERDHWAWFSWRKPDNSVVPLFHGRLIAMPSDFTRNVIRLEFIARPEDFEEQKIALAETLKVEPFWDPIWIDETRIDDPDVVLAARSALWHIGRTDKTVTISDIIAGEEGTIELDGDDVFSESLTISTNEPVRKINVEATVEWIQFAKGEVNLAPSLVEAFKVAGAPTGRVSSYTGQGLEATWPRFGDQIGGGWSVSESRPNLLNKSIEKSDYFQVNIDPKKATPDFKIEEWWEDSPEGFDYWYGRAYDAWLSKQMRLPIRRARFYEWEFAPDFTVQYEASRGRREVLTFEVVADLQPMISDGEPKIADIKISSNTIGAPIDPDDELPIRDIGRNHFFGSDRAEQSIAYLLAMARSRFLFGARAVEVSVDIPFALGVDLSCRHDVILSLDELPGGVCGGKVIGYRFGLNGDEGEFFASVTLGCSIGNGAELPEANTAEPDYVEHDYVDNYQNYSGGSLQPIAGEISYEPFEIVVPDDGTDFGNMTPASTIGSLAASALLTFTGPGVAAETITVHDRAYTLVAALSGANQILIGDDLEETARNFADAINGDESNLGVTYGAGTLGNATVAAVASDGIVRVTARALGAAGNALVISDTSSQASWNGLTLAGGSDGILVINGPNVQRAAMDDEWGSIQQAIDGLNAVFTRVRVAMKPVTGGPFETLINLTVSDLMVPKTIDFAAGEVTA